MLEIIYNRFISMNKHKSKGSCYVWHTLAVAKYLLSWKLTITGTPRQNKPYIPKQVAANKLRPEYSSLFGFHERNVALCSYVPKKNKAVILLSTMHSDTPVTDERRDGHLQCFSTYWTLAHLQHI